MRILIVQRSLSPPGGGHAVAASMVQALAGTHEVGTLTGRTWSAAETNGRDSRRSFTRISGDAIGCSDSLRERLRTHAQSLSTESFVERVRAIVNGIR